MKEKSISKLIELNQLNEEIFKSLEAYSHAKLFSQPAENEWSILQTLEHLRISEELSLKYLKFKKTQNNDYKKTGIKEQFNVFILKKRMESPKKIKAPNVKGLSPEPDGLELKEIADAWIKGRSEIMTYFEETAVESFSKNIYKHPAIGRINLYQMLQFFEYHIKRHQRQFHKRLKSIR